MTFAYPWVLLGLLLIPALAIWFFAPRLRRARQPTFLFSGVGQLKRQSRGVRQYLTPVLDGVVLVALTLLIVAMARPQAMQEQEVEVEGIDIYLSLDMSGSMRAIDLTEQELQSYIARNKEPLNRFDSAIAVLKEFVSTRKHDRVGLVIFAKEAFLQFPLTLDHNIIQSSLDRLRLGDIDEAGTAIGNAMGRAIAGFRDSDAETKILILITDGDRRGGNISPKQAAEMAKELGITVYPILVGKDGMALAPVGRNLFTGRTSYRQVEFPIDPDLLQEIAETTGGTYYRATNAEGLRKDLHAILDEYDRSRIEDVGNIEYDELFRPFVLWAIVLLLGQFMLRHTLCRSFP